MISLNSDNGLPLTRQSRYPLTEITSTYVNFSRRFLESKKSFLYMFLNCSLKVASVRSLCRNTVFNLLTHFKTDTRCGYQLMHHFTDNKEALFTGVKMPNTFAINKATNSAKKDIRF